MGVCRESFLVVWVAVALSVASVVGAGAATGDERAWAKVSPELRALYTASVEAREGGRSTATPDLGLTIVEDRVIVDAVAAADVEDLRRSLVALGMREAATAGRIVSGQLPIAAIPAAAALPSLRFVRAAVTAPRGAGGGVQQR
jgi:hypothetical protein